MVLRDFDLLWKNFGIMEKTMVRCTKTMVLWKKKLWYYTENNGTSIYSGKTWYITKKLRNFYL